MLGYFLGNFKTFLFLKNLEIFQLFLVPLIHFIHLNLTFYSIYSPENRNNALYLTKLAKIILISLTLINVCI